MLLFAEIGAENVVQRVIVADSIQWCAEHLGGWWVETRQGAEPERYAGPGMVYAPSDSRKFLYPSEVT